MSDEAGRWSYEAELSDGASGTSGTFQCVKSRLHGPLQVRRDNRLWFQFADGTPFYIRAHHTWTIDVVDREKLAEALDFLQRQGFNTCAGPHLSPPTACRGSGAAMARSTDYLTELQRHAEELTSSPEQWMPWN
jgi:hypothetical protein